MDQSVPIVSRKEWMGRNQDSCSKDANYKIKHPVEVIIIMDTKTEYSDSADVNAVLVKFIESIDVIVHDQKDIRYNFLIGGDAQIYEGCGWNVKGNHAANWNDKSIGIGFIGNFDSNNLNQNQIRNLNALIMEGVKSNKVTKDCAVKRLLKGEIKDINLSYDE